MEQRNIKGLNARYAAVMGAYWMSYGQVFAFASVFLLSRGFGDSQIGMVMAIGNVLAVLLQSPVASFADRTRRISLSRICALVGLAVIGFAVLLLAAPSAKGISGTLFLLAVTFVQLLQPLTNALGMFFVNRGFKLNFGAVRGIGSISYAVATYAMGIFIERFGENAIMVGLAVMYVVFIMGTLLLDTRKSSYPDAFIQGEDAKRTQRAGEEASTLGQFVCSYKKFMVMLIGVALLFANHNILNTYLFQIMTGVGGNSKDMGISLSIAAASELPTMLAFSWLIKKYKCKSLMQVSALFFTVKSFLFVVAGSVGMIHAAQLVQILAFALFTPASVYYVNQNIQEKDHVKGQALSTTANTVGAVIGSLAGGQVLEAFGARPMLLLGAILSAAGTVIVFLCAEDGKQNFE